MVRWTAQGKTSVEIAELLSISEHTVNTYMNNAIRKLDCVNRAASGQDNTPWPDKLIFLPVQAVALPVENGAELDEVGANAQNVKSHGGKVRGHDPTAFVAVGNDCRLDA